jgi:hypothetical protein
VSPQQGKLISGITTSVDDEGVFQDATKAITTLGP